MKSMSCRTGIVLLIALAGVAGPGAGRTQAQNVKLTTEVGVRAFTDKISTEQLAKFEEYRQVPSGLFLQGLRLQYETPGFTQLELGAQNAGRRDQGFWLNGSKPGLFDFRAGWDQIPHTYSSTARMIGSITNFALPNPRPDTATWNSTSSALDPIRNRWDAGRVSLSLRPTEALESKAEYTLILKDGNRPIGMAFGSPGNNYREILEPIDQTTHDLKLTQSLAREHYQLQVSYNLSVFQNANTTLEADNPLVATNGTSGAARGRLGLAPDNLAHTFAFAGGLNLPMRTRISTQVTYGLQKQNADFIPFTTNTALTLPNPGNLPTSLNGDLRTTLANITASTRPVRNVNITARYRLYDQNDKTGHIALPFRVSNDRSLTVAEYEREHFPFQRHNAGVDLGWHPNPVVSFKVGYAWERFNRAEDRNVTRSTESTPRIAIDVTPADWVLLRASYAHSERRANEYRQLIAVDLPEFFRFDLNDRDRDRSDFLLQFTPVDQLTVSGTFAVGRNHYRQPDEVFDTLGVRFTPTQPYGVRDDNNKAAGIDIAWTPVTRLNLFGSYMYERFDLKQRNRMRESTQLANLSFDWLGRTRERINTASVGFSAVIVPGKLKGGFSYDWSEGATFLRTANPTTPPTGGTASQNSQAVAVNLPEITHMLNPVRGYLSYNFAPDWALSAGYTYEKFEEKEFRTDGLKPATGADIMLGNDFRNYTAGYFTFTVSYRPGLMLVRRPIL